MSKEALSDYIFIGKYAQWNFDEGRRETKAEARTRMFDMHRRRYATNKVWEDDELQAHLDDNHYKFFNFGDAQSIEDQIQFLIDEAESAFADELCLGSQRALQYGGVPCERQNSRIFNCTASYADRARFFQEAFHLLLCGAGTGFSVQWDHVKTLPAIAKPTGELVEYIIPDSIEGWADAVGVLISSYCKHADQAPFPEFAGKRVVFNFDEIRPEGADLSSGVGKAPGPEPLKLCLKEVKGVLTRVVTRLAGPWHAPSDHALKLHAGSQMQPIDAYDIVMHCSDAVLSGGVRRSASVCFFSIDDEEMMNAKTGSWFVENPQRGRSNNSAVCIRGETTWEEFEKLFQAVQQFGEPGFYWVNSPDEISNPCFAPETRIATSNGMMRIQDMVGRDLDVTADIRIGPDDVLNLDAGHGVRRMRASQAQLTQESVMVYTLTTKHGHKIKATANHKFPTQRGRLRLDRLEEGDTLYLPSGEGVWGTRGDFDSGLILGTIAGDGTFAKDEAFVDVWEGDQDILEDLGTKVSGAACSVEARPGSTTSLTWMDSANQKRMGGVRLHRWMEETMGETPRSVKDKVPECVFQGSREMVRGYLQGLFFADGSVNCGGKGKKQTVSLRLHQSNEPMLREVQTLLSNFGIVSSIHLRRDAGMRELPDGNGGLKEYYCKAAYDLIINRPNCVTFEKEIGLYGRKAELLKSVLDARGRDYNKPERFITKVVDISFDRVTDVYCLNQPETNVVTANGVVTGNCVEIGLQSRLPDGRTGWQNCNLSTINILKTPDEKTFLRAARAAAIIGTLQAGYTNFPYLGEVSEALTANEALLGVSMTGIAERPEIGFNPELLAKGAEVIKQTNELVSLLTGIKPAARATCVKPEGTSSAYLGTSSGIHGHHAKRYFRRVQNNHLEPQLMQYAASNPRAVEKSVWGKSGTDKVVTFCIESEPGAITRNELHGEEMLDKVLLVKRHWVDNGKVVERCTKPTLSHNVSNTVTVQEGDWDNVARKIFDNQEDFSGVSLLAHSGDLDYPQAPFCEVLSDDEILARYGSGCLLASGLIVDGVRVFDGNLWAACDVVLGRGEDIEAQREALELKKMQAAMGAGWDDDSEDLIADDLGFENSDEYVLHHKEDFVRRAKQFADRYFDGDNKLMTECLKHVHNLKLWMDLERTHTQVDYTTMDDAAEKIKVAETVACAGGACEVL